MRVFCIDIGYSLKAECRRWKEDPCSYPGQALYGINYFEKYGITPVFERREHGYIFGKWYAWIDEWVKLIHLIRFRKQYDLIYIPHAYYSRWIFLLKTVGLIQKPVVACMHNKNNLWKLIRMCDGIFTINPYLQRQLTKKYPDVEISYVPLMPEKKISALQASDVRYDVISVGNTHRDYRVLTEAMRGLPYNCLIVTSLDVGEDLPENVKVEQQNKDYKECLRLYRAASVIVLPISEEASDGVFGLTSLVDALGVLRPVIVTATRGLGLPIEKQQLGIEVAAGDVEKMREAICRLMEDEALRKQISRNMEDFEEKNHMENSAAQICQILKKAGKVDKR